MSKVCLHISWFPRWNMNKVKQNNNAQTAGLCFDKQLWYKSSCAIETTWTDAANHHWKETASQHRGALPAEVKDRKGVFSLHTHFQSHRFVRKRATAVQPEWCYNMSFSIWSRINGSHIWSRNSGRGDNTHTHPNLLTLRRAAADKTALLDKASRQLPSSQRRNIMAKWKCHR